MIKSIKELDRWIEKFPDALFIHYFDDTFRIQAHDDLHENVSLRVRDAVRKAGRIKLIGQGSDAYFFKFVK